MRQLCNILQNKICVILTGDENDEDIEKLENIEFVELRIDEFLRKYNEDELIKWILKIKERLKCKLIATIRWYKENGENPYYIKDQKRIEIFKNVINYVDFIDIELKSRILKQVVEITKNVKDKKIIISYHNFKKTPNEKKLKEIIRKGKKEKGDIIKIATLTKTKKSLFDLIKITYFYSKEIPLIIIPMSENPFIRFIPIFLGSLFTYVPLSKKVAPGQITYFDL